MAAVLRRAVRFASRHALTSIRPAAIVFSQVVGLEKSHVDCNWRFPEKMTLHIHVC